MHCDLNCDLGEGTGNDAAIMPFISSANIACGYHAGDEATMKEVVDLCIKNNVAIGAHPSYPDKENFGRVDLLDTTLKQEDLFDVIVTQVKALQVICKDAGATLHHVKPHGALYNRAAWDIEVSNIICNAIKYVDENLILYGLSGSQMQATAAVQGIPFCNEVFADRTYQKDGSLTPRTAKNALIETENEAQQQVLQMVLQGTVHTATGNTIAIAAETICIHGDGKHAVAFAKSIYEVLKKYDITITAPLK